MDLRHKLVLLCKLPSRSLHPRTGRDWLHLGRNKGSVFKVLSSFIMKEKDRFVEAERVKGGERREGEGRGREKKERKRREAKERHRWLSLPLPQNWVEVGESGIVATLCLAINKKMSTYLCQGLHSVSFVSKVRFWRYGIVSTCQR